MEASNIALSEFDLGSGIFTCVRAVTGSPDLSGRGRFISSTADSRVTSTAKKNPGQASKKGTANPFKAMNQKGKSRTGIKKKEQQILSKQ